MSDTRAGFYCPDNFLEATGRVVKITPKTKTHTVLVLSTANGMIKAFPHFSVRPDLIGDLKVGEYVHVTGHIHAQRYMVNGRPTNGQPFVADTLEKVPSLLGKHFGIDGRFHETSFFRAYLHGKITKVSTDHGYDRIWILVPGDGVGSDKRPVNVRLSQKSGYTAQKPGDELYTVTGVTTNVREKDDGDRGYVRYENLLAMESYVVGKDGKAVPRPNKEPHKVVVSVNEDVKAELDAAKADENEEYADQFIL
jgi:hypothetical protein